RGSARNGPRKHLGVRRGPHAGLRYFGTVPGRTRRVDAVLAPCVLAPRPLVRSSRFHHRSPPVPPRTARPARSLRMIAQNTRSSTTSSSAIRDVEALIESAADVVAPQWPLATFA